jgi:hypothetical protein
MSEPSITDATETPPPYFSPESARVDSACFLLAPPGMGEYSPIIARVMNRLPIPDQKALSNRLVFVVGEFMSATYLSPALTRGRNLIVFGDGIRHLSDDDAAESLLPQVALALLQARCVCEPPLVTQSWKWLDPETRKVTDEKLYEQDVKEQRSAMADLQIDVHFAQKKADALVRQWQAKWAAANPKPETPG